MVSYTLGGGEAGVWINNDKTKDDIGNQHQRQEADTPSASTENHITRKKIHRTVFPNSLKEIKHETTNEIIKEF